MKFDCGETAQARQARIQKWHPFFVLFPRTVKEENGRKICAWMETIERRGYWIGYPLFVWEWEYRPRQSMNSERE